jgi:hypothetical protein
MNFADEPLEIVMASAKPKPDFERDGGPRLQRLRCRH